MPVASTHILLPFFLATLSAQSIQPETIFRIQPAERTRRLVSVDTSGKQLLFCFSDSRATELVRTDLAGGASNRDFAFVDTLVQVSSEAKGDRLILTKADAGAGTCGDTSVQIDAVN